MSDLSATNCGCNNDCDRNNGILGGCGCIWIILLLLFCGGNNGICGGNSCGCGNGILGGHDNNNCCCDILIWIVLIFLFCGNNNCGCGC